MRYSALAVLLLSLAGAVQAQTTAGPALVYGEFSGIYDQYKHRKQLPNCPSEAEAAPHLAHALDLWEHQGAQVMERIRKASEMPGFPRREIIIWFIACGRSISAPVTVAVYRGGPDGPFVALTDQELLVDIAHEILHNVVNTPAYGDARYFANTAYPKEDDETTNHIIVAALETRMYGYEAVRKRYSEKATYARALELAMRFGIGSKEPMP